MSFAQNILARERPDSVRLAALPRRTSFFPSPTDWRDEVIYFLLPDRFSDGGESDRPLVNPKDRGMNRPAGFRWDEWAASGGDRFQGGTLNGITSKLDYLNGLGVTTLWVGPTFKQRTHFDSYHGYAIQDFLDIDPRFGNRQDMVQLVAEAHKRGIRILLDVVFNHTGNNWIYANGEDQPPFLPWPRFYQKGDWRNRRGDLTDTIHRADDGVWPREFQRDEYYSRAGDGGSSASPSISKSYYEQFRKSFEATRPESPSAGTVNSFRKPLVVRQNADADSCRPASGWLPLFYHSAMV